MERTAILSWQQVWSLTLALVLALTVIGAAPEFAAAEKKESMVEQRDRFEAACIEAGGFSYGSDSSNFGCYLEDVTIECNHGMVVLHGWSSCERVMEFDLDESNLVQPNPSPSNTADTLFRIHTLSGPVWLSSEPEVSDKADGNGESAGSNAEVLPPATVVWTARGKTIVTDLIDAQAANDTQRAPQRMNVTDERVIIVISAPAADQASPEPQAEQADPSEASADSQLPETSNTDEEAGHS